MTPWLLSIVGIVVVGVLVELLLTDSAVSKFIRGIYAFFILFVIVAPIPGFVKNASESIGGSVILDTALLVTINERTAETLTRTVEDTLAKAGFESIIAVIDFDPTASSFKIERVHLNAIGIVKGGSSVNIKRQIVEIAAVTCGVSTDIVEVYI